MPNKSRYVPYSEINVAQMADKMLKIANNGFDKDELVAIAFDSLCALVEYMAQRKAELVNLSERPNNIYYAQIISELIMLNKFAEARLFLLSATELLAVGGQEYGKADIEKAMSWFDHNHPALLDNEDCDGSPYEHPAYARGSAASAVIMCSRITDIMDGKDGGEGTASEPWNTVRNRLLELVKSHKPL